MAKDVSAWRKRLDDLKHKTNKKKEQLNSLQDKHKEYSLCVVDSHGAGLGDENHPDCRTIRSLENRLDKVMIKHNEGLRIKKTYEVILQRLKDERKGYESQLGLIE